MQTDYLFNGIRGYSRFKDLRECHVKLDLPLIYKVNDDILELALVQVGNHGSLFK